MSAKISSQIKASFNAPGLLLCDISGRTDLPCHSDLAWASSPVTCLDQAVELSPHLIVIRFGRGSFKERHDLVELSTVLKRNRHTRHCSILALLPVKHRDLMEELDLSGVDFIRYFNENSISLNQLPQLISDLGPLDRLKRQLAMMCPLLHYSPIDACRELKLCGGYLDRMVLSQSRLRQVCQTEAHLGCEHYLNPKRKDSDDL